MIEIEDVAKIIELNGARLYLVGGAVRDKLFNIQSHDEDYCVVGMSSEKFEKLFPEAIKKGKNFPVYDLYGKEFAMARSEQKNGKAHTDFCIEANEKITIIEDLKRRDITINSIAQNVLTGEIIDPFDGINDFKNKLIRATSSAFTEDPLRAYRAARFASKFNFCIEEGTLKLMSSLKSSLKYLSAERVFDEFRKAINTKYPDIFFNVLRDSGILEIHFEEIYKLIGASQPIEHHPEGDSYNHTMLALKMASKITSDEKIRFSALVHDLGKGVTPKEEYPHHYGHDAKGVNEVKKFGKRLKMPRAWIECGITSCAEHMKGGIFYKMTPGKQIDFIERVSKTKLGLRGLEIVVEADRNCRGLSDEKIIKFADLGEKIINRIDGNYVIELYPNLKPGIQLKQKIHEERIKYLRGMNLQRDA